MKRIPVLLIFALLLALCPFHTAYAAESSEPDLPVFDNPGPGGPTDAPATAPVDPAVKAPDEDAPFTIDLSIVGDCLLSTYKGGSYKGSLNWYAATQKPSYFFEKVYDIFSADDFTIANLETVLTDRKLAEVKKNGSRVFWFRGPSANARILTAGSIEAVSLANNHTNDYGAEGQKDTIAAVEAQNVLYGNESKTIYLEKNGFTIAVICHGLWREGQADEIITRIQSASEKSDYQIVFYHGGTEAVLQPEAWRVRASRKLVDNGADMVIGNHPHVPQPMEVYKGVDIVYSLGNFCFGGHNKPRNRTIIYKMLLTIQDGHVSKSESSFIPCYVYTGKTNNWQPAVLADAAAKQKVLDFMYGRRSSPY